MQCFILIFFRPQLQHEMPLGVCKTFQAWNTPSSTRLFWAKGKILFQIILSQIWNKTFHVSLFKQYLSVPFSSTELIFQKVHFYFIFPEYSYCCIDLDWMMWFESSNRSSRAEKNIVNSALLLGRQYQEMTNLE